MATRFWVGGTGTWDGVTTTNWAATTGGAGGQTVPGSGDTVTFDGASGGGVVTVNTTVNITSLSCGAFTGTLDFATNNNNLTANTVNISGSGTRTINLGSGTFTLNGGNGNIWDSGTPTNLTLSAANVTLKSTGNGLGAATYFFANTQSFGNIQLGSEAGQIIWRYQINVASFGRVTFNTMTINPVSHVELQSGVTVTTTLTANGTAFNNSIILDNIAAVNFIIPNNTTFNWCVIKNYQSTATGVTATNSLDLGHNSSITITGPAAGGGSGIIGS